MRPTEPRQYLSRSALVRRGGAALIASSAVAAWWSGEAAAAVPDNDLAYLRLLIGVELLAADFQAQALASGRLSGPAAAAVKQMQADEKAHYNGLAQLVSAAGQVPATADDIDFEYPKGAFASQKTVFQLAWSIETISVGAYMGAIENVQTAQLRLPIGQIGANEAQHVSALAPTLGRPVIGRAFAPALTIDEVSAALDGYES
ncbi:MAG TPA: ferritin-like domain-containing protein [Gaiellaceae bacterium]|nr:ferritin-like domain-containing protein [Gaiellaceae bacterium]